MANILIVVADFYQDISQALVDGAVERIKADGHSYEIAKVPGALEVAAAISMADESAKYDGFVAIGCVIRGETSHYDTVCNESARGLNDLAVHGPLAIGNGIITVENKEQAIARSSKDDKNKGKGAAEAVLVMMKLQEKWLAHAPEGI